MRVECKRHNITAIIAVSAMLLASCAQQPTRPTPAPVEERTTPAPAPTPPTVPKPKPKPKPAPAPKPETKEPETAPAPLEGIESSKVGYYFDTLQGRLRQLAAPDAVVSRKDDHITLDITRRVRVGNDGSGQCAALAPIAKALVEYRMTRIAVDVGSETNDDAGRRTAKSRSESIAQCFVDAGVASRRIVSNGVAGATQMPTIILRIEPVVRAP
jgi:type IV secretory pathway VirB10-like protein